MKLLQGEGQNTGFVGKLTKRQEAFVLTHARAILDLFGLTREPTVMDIEASRRQIFGASRPKLVLIPGGLQ